jgi:hypothetical protein
MDEDEVLVDWAGYPVAATERIYQAREEIGNPVVEETPMIHLKADDIGAIRQMLSDIAQQERILAMMRTAMIYEFRKEYGVDLNDDWELDLVERTLKKKGPPSMSEIIPAILNNK